MPRYVPVSANAAPIFAAPDNIFHVGFWQSRFLKELNDVDFEYPNAVTITSPAGGESIGTRFFTITWTEASPQSPLTDEGDCVSYRIDYSIDCGDNWTQAIDNNGDDILCLPQGTTSVVWDLGAIPDTTEGMIRVCSVSSYGCGETCAESEKFEITGGSCF